MKTQKFKKVSIIAVAFLMTLGMNSYAQQGRNYGQGQKDDQRKTCQIPDLTEEQEAKINDLRLEKTKEMTTFRNQMNELRAKKQTLMTSDNSDSKEINGVIDQMTDIHNKMMKTSAKHHQDVRSLLTDEQKIIFDSRPMRGHGQGQGHGMRNGSGHGRGAGQCRVK